MAAHLSSHEESFTIRRLLQLIGIKILNFLFYVSGVTFLSLQTFYALVRYRWRFSLIVEQFYFIANRSFSIVALISIFTGMVLALQFTVSLGQFGLKLYAGPVVGISIVRELGPVLTALMIAARVGSGIAAELGSMVVTEQVLAIEAMGGNPIQQLVVPRVLATVIGTPLLTVGANALGILGGMVILMSDAGLTPQFYLDQIWQAVTMEDFAHGIAKTFIFGFFISIVACYQGLQTVGGTAGVGQSTTRAVVYGSVLIFIIDFFLTRLLIFL